MKGSALYIDVPGINLWNDHFKKAELTEVVRQKDYTFAQLLNRIRVHAKNSPMLDEDVNMLKQRETGEEMLAVHIFATNNQVNDFNSCMLTSKCPNASIIEAQDFQRNPKTGRLELKIGHHGKVFHTCLKSTLSFGKGARVMLKKNIVSDGLVYGAVGTVVDILYKSNQSFPSAIHVQFDDDKAGQMQRVKNRITSSQITIIHPQEDKVTNDGGMRRQYPLQLAWACTVHKMQGLTVENAVVCLKKIFAPGQAYVALGRVTSLTGL